MGSGCIKWFILWSYLIPAVIVVLTIALAYILDDDPYGGEAVYVHLTAQNFENATLLRNLLHCCCI